MNDSHTLPDDDEFEATLRTVIERAAENGTDVKGAWKVSADDGDERAHWDVRITAVEYEDANGE